MNIQHSASTRERELAARLKAAHGSYAGRRLFAMVSLPMALVAASALLALIMGVALPADMVEMLFDEGGFVESATLVVYAFAMVAIWLPRSPQFGRVSAVAATVVLAACVAREISLRRWMMEMDGDGFCCAQQVNASLTVIVVVALAVATVVLCRRHAAQVWRGLVQKEAVPTTLFAIFCATTLSQLFDRLPALLTEQSLPMRSALLALSLEETLELLIPVLVIVAALQARFERAG